MENIKKSKTQNMKIKSANKEYKMSDEEDNKQSDCKECGVKLNNFEINKGICNECSQEKYFEKPKKKKIIKKKKIVKSDSDSDLSNPDSEPTEPTESHLNIKLNNMVKEESFNLSEKYDIHEMAKLLNSDVLDLEWKSRMKKYRKFSHFGIVKVNYKRNKIGRLDSNCLNCKDDETLTTQSYMKGVCKSVLCSKLYYDLDLINAHPVMLYQLLVSYEIDCPNIHKYTLFRDEIIKEYMGKTEMNRDDIKQLLCLICYGGSATKFLNEKKVPDNEDCRGYFLELEKELKSCRTKLLNKPEYFNYKMKAHNDKGADYHNVEGTALSYLLQTHECNILMVMFRYIQNHLGDDSVGALIHDGLHIDRKKVDDYGVDKLIDEIQKAITHQTCFRLKLKIKPFQPVPEVNKIISVSTDKEAGDIVSDKLKNDYITSQERIFLRINNVWTENEKKIKKELNKIVGNFNIMIEKMNEKTGEIELKEHSRMNKGCKDILNFVEPTEDEDFIDKLWTSNLFKLCFKNGYYDFKSKELKNYDTDTHTTIKINRDFNKAKPEIKQQVFMKILDPIFNNNNEMRDCWLNYVARGLAGHIEDKNWAVGTGERDCGKGVLVGLLENCFGEYCRSTNSENFLFKNNGQDSAKALSWLVPFEFKRLLLTNEITKDAENKIRINGNILKKLSSGGDRIEARVNHKDEINFKVQARVCMFCNDLPPIEPSDAKETSYMFKYPSKFLDEEDPRLEKPVKIKVQKMNESTEELEDVLDENGEVVYKTLTQFYKKDDEIKEWCKSQEVIDAFIEIIFDNYSKKVPVPQCMKEEQDEFKMEETDESRFYDLFTFMDDANYNTETSLDWLSIDVINIMLKKEKINLSAQKYKNLLLSKGCVKCKKTKKDGKRVNAWANIQVYKGKKEDLANAGYQLIDENDEDDEE